MLRGDALRRRRAGGFTYIGLLALIVLIGILLAAAGQVSSTTSQRERETELLYIGHAYRAAIGQYYAVTRRYPLALEELVQIGDGPRPTRFLRKLYRDPMTNAVDWTLLPGPDGGIIGIASSSKRAPLKSAGFDREDAVFEDATSYADWVFSNAPSAAPKRLKSRASP
jgi:type II secretory pathway pseudopilin PulG